MGTVLSSSLIDLLNNMSPAAQVALLGTQLDNALAGILPSGSISTDEIANLAITNAKIAAVAVDAAKIAANAVETVKIAADAVTKTKINADVVGAGMQQESDGTIAIADAGDVTRLADSIALAESLRVNLNAHAADAADHTTAPDATNFPLTSPTATTLASLKTLIGEMLTDYAAHDDDAELASAWAFHKAQEASDHSLASVDAPTSLAECVTRLNDIKAKFNAHDADATAHGVGSNHQEATADATGNIAILASAIKEPELGSITASGISVGPYAVKVIAAAQLKALLNTSENVLFPVNAGDIPIQIIMNVGTAAGAACVVDIGYDAAADGSAKDADGFVEDFDANAAAKYDSLDNTYAGVYTLAGPKAAAANGNVIITSSTDQSASAFVGWAVMIYVPA